MIISSQESRGLIPYSEKGFVAANFHVNHLVAVRITFHIFNFVWSTVARDYNIRAHSITGPMIRTQAVDFGMVTS